MIKLELYVPIKTDQSSPENHFFETIYLPSVPRVGEFIDFHTDDDLWDFEVTHVGYIVKNSNNSDYQIQVFLKQIINT